MRTIAVSSPGLTGRVAVAFHYDPELKELVKQVPGRTWDEKNKVWVLPSIEAIAELQRLCPPDVNVKLPPQVAAAIAKREAAIAAAHAARAKGDSGLDFPYVTAPYGHQRAGLEFLVNLGSGALFWEMGTGKTKTAIDYAMYLAQAKMGDAVRELRPLAFPAVTLRVLVICPNTVKRNWLAEIEKHTGRADLASVPEGSLKERATQLGFRMFTIVNCEALSLDPLAAAIVAYPWDLVIVDESTRFKTPGAARTKRLHKIKAAHRVILTGTPITGKAWDAWSQLEFVKPGLFGRWWGFEQTYLVRNKFTRQIEGLRPGAESILAAKVATISYRVLKADVLDLPPKVYEDRIVEMRGAQAKAYASMRDELRIQLENAPDLTAWNVLTQLLRLTQVTAGLIGEQDRYTWLDGADNAKQAELDDLLNGELAGEQVVIFGLYQKELEALARRYTFVGGMRGGPLAIDAEYSGKGAMALPIIYGPTPPAMRQNIIDEFQRGERRLLFVQTSTGGIGINLTAARTAIYYSRSWSLEDYLQSQDRLHRIGQTGTVTVLHLTAKGSVDEDIAKALAVKQNVADRLTGDAARRLVATVLKG